MRRKKQPNHPITNKHQQQHLISSRDVRLLEMVKPLHRGVAVTHIYKLHLLHFQVGALQVKGQVYTHQKRAAVVWAL